MIPVPRELCFGLYGNEPMLRLPLLFRILPIGRLEEEAKIHCRPLVVPKVIVGRSLQEVGDWLVRQEFRPGVERLDGQGIVLVLTGGEGQVAISRPQGRFKFPELKAEQEFHALLAQDRAADPTPNLVAASRMRLQEALETAKQGSFYSRLAFDPANWLRQVRFSPALASAILILGFAGGVTATYKLYGPRPTNTAGVQNTANPTAVPAEASITGI